MSFVDDFNNALYGNQQPNAQNNAPASQLGNNDQQPGGFNLLHMLLGIGSGGMSDIVGMLGGKLTDWVSGMVTGGNDARAQALQEAKNMADYMARTQMWNAAGAVTQGEVQPQALRALRGPMNNAAGLQTYFTQRQQAGALPQVAENQAVAQGRQAAREGQRLIDEVVKIANSANSPSSALSAIVRQGGQQMGANRQNIYGENVKNLQGALAASGQLYGQAGEGLNQNRMAYFKTNVEPYLAQQNAGAGVGGTLGYGADVYGKYNQLQTDKMYQQQLPALQSLLGATGSELTSTGLYSMLNKRAMGTQNQPVSQEALQYIYNMMQQNQKNKQGGW